MQPLPRQGIGQFDPVGIVRIGDEGVDWLRVLGGGLVDAAQGSLIGGSGSASGLVLIRYWGSQFYSGFIQLGGVDAGLAG